MIRSDSEGLAHPAAMEIINSAGNGNSVVFKAEGRLGSMGPESCSGNCESFEARSRGEAARAEQGDGKRVCLN